MWGKRKKEGDAAAPLGQRATAAASPGQLVRPDNELGLEGATYLLGGPGSLEEGQVRAGRSPRQNHRSAC